MLYARTHLTDEDLRAIADLEQRVVARDGGRLKIEWADLRARTADPGDGPTTDLLWRTPGDDAGCIDGYFGLDSWDGRTVELVGMVDPTARGRGIGTALLDAAVQVCRDRGFEKALLIVPRPSVAGHHLAARRGAPLEHSEHALRLDTPPALTEQDPRTTVRPATRDDLGALATLLTAAFGEAPTHLEAGFAEGGTLVVEHAGEVVGTLRTQRDGGSAGIYGFAVAPGSQGRGIGRDVLRRTAQRLFDDGATSVRLEVAVDNDRALGLYTSIGFRRVQTEDYYALPL